MIYRMISFLQCIIFEPISYSEFILYCNLQLNFGLFYQSKLNTYVIYTQNSYKSTRNSWNLNCIHEIKPNTGLYQKDYEYTIIMVYLWGYKLIMANIIPTFSCTQKYIRIACIRNDPFNSSIMGNPLNL